MAMQSLSTTSQRLLQAMAARGGAHRISTTRFSRTAATFAAVTDAMDVALGSRKKFHQPRNLVAQSTPFTRHHCPFLVFSGRRCGDEFTSPYHSTSKRNFRATTTPATATVTPTPLDAEDFQSRLLSQVPAMAASLLDQGYFTTTDLLPLSTIATLRNQSIALRFEHNRFEASYSETIDESTGRVKERFDKEGVYACEPDGRDYYEATDLITYMSLLLQTLPASLNAEWEANSLQDSGAAAAGDTVVPTSTPTLSSESFNAKLAVTEHGGAKYPLHVDNPQGLAAGDTRKLTCILYLNPDHQEGVDGGEIRLFLPKSESSWETLDLSPIGGRLLAFWSDEIPHEVLPTAAASSSSASSSSSDTTNHEKDRYALTIWIPTSDATCLHNATSKFHNLKDLVFEGTKKNNDDSNKT